MEIKSYYYSKTNLIIYGIYLIFSIIRIELQWRPHYIHSMAPSIVHFIQLNKFIYLKLYPLISYIIKTQIKVARKKLQN